MLPFISSLRLLRSEYLILIAIPFLIFFIYSPALNGPFVFDDINNIEKNSSIHIKNLSLESLKTAASGHRPVATVSFALNYYIHGLSPYWFRVVNIVIHIATSWVLYIFICKTLSIFEEDNNNKLLAAISALVWAIHPLQIQSVTYIVQRMNSLAGLFFLLAMLIYIEARQSELKLLKLLLFTLSCFSIFLAIKSKPNAVTIFPSILLYEIIFLQKIKDRSSKNIFFVIFTALAALCLLLYFLSTDAASHIPFTNLPAWYNGKGFTLTQYLLTEFRVLVFYISLVFYPQPSRLNIDHEIFYSTSLFNPLVTFASVLVVLILISISIFYVKKYKVLTFGVLWFFVNHSVESTIIPLDFIFEHRNYIPSMMFIFGILYTLKQYNKKIINYIAILIIVILSVWTFQRNTVWENGLSLWEDSSLKSKNKSRPRENFAYYLEQEGRIEDAIKSYKKAIELYPSNHKNVVLESHIGDLFAKKGDMTSALAHYNNAFVLNPKSREILNSLGNFFYRSGNFDQAASFYKEALKIDKKSVVLNVNLGNAMAALGDIDASFKYYSKAISLEKSNIEANYNLALLFVRKKDFPRAANTLKYVLAIKPNLKEAHSSLGMVNEQLNQYELAIENYKDAINLDANFKYARESLNRLLKQQGK